MYGIFTSVGVFVISNGTISYFIEVPPKIVIILSIIFTIIPIALFFSNGVKLALNFSLISFGAGLMSTFIVPLFNWDKNKKILGKTITYYYLLLAVLTLYVPVVLLVYSGGYSFGLFYSNDVVLIFLNYLNVIMGTIIMIIYFIHLEYSLTDKERYDIKDKYSHNMGNILQTIYLSVDLLKTDEKMTKSDRKNLAGVIEDRIKRAGKILEEVREIK